MLCSQTKRVQVPSFRNRRAPDGGPRMRAFGVSGGVGGGGVGVRDALPAVTEEEEDDMQGEGRWGGGGGGRRRNTDMTGLGFGSSSGKSTSTPTFSQRAPSRGTGGFVRAQSSSVGGFGSSVAPSKPAAAVSAPPA